VSAGALMAPLSSRLPLGEAGTLDELVVALWEGLRADRSVACPVCGAEMKPEYGAHARAIGGGCSTCGSRLH
jgi:hypothetical protein